MTVHLVAVLCWAIVIAALTAASPKSVHSTTRLWQVACATGVALLLGVSGAAVIFLIKTMLRERTRDGSSTGSSAPLHLLIALFVGYVVGLVFLRNVTIKMMQPVLGDIWPWSHSAILQRFYSTFASVSFSFI